MLFLALIIMFRPEISMNAAKEALLTFSKIVLPTLFPFIVCANIILNLGGAQLFSRIFSPFMKIFLLPGDIGISYFTSLAAGYPTGLNSLSKQLKATDENNLLAASLLCSNVGPMFIIGAIGTLLGNIKLAWIILLSHYLGGIITAFIASLIFKKRKTLLTYDIKSHNFKFTDALDNSIQNASLVMIKICGCIVIMRVFSAIILSTPIGIILQKVNFIDLNLIIRGFFEMADACIFIAKGNNVIYSCITISAIVSFGGISVILQSISYLKILNVKIKTYMFFKAVHAFISSIICYITLKLIPITVFTLSTKNSNNISSYDYANFGFTILIGITLVYIILQWPRIWERFCRTISRFR